ncbi:MAG: hypothetical protein ACMXYC_04885 [Candidatus Woesearchaeota archaeon]
MNTQTQHPQQVKQISLPQEYIALCGTYNNHTIVAIATNLECIAESYICTPARLYATYPHGLLSIPIQKIMCGPGKTVIEEYDELDIEEREQLLYKQGQITDIIRDPILNHSGIIQIYDPFQEIHYKPLSSTTQEALEDIINTKKGRVLVDEWNRVIHGLFKDKCLTKIEQPDGQIAWETYVLDKVKELT